MHHHLGQLIVLRQSSVLKGLQVYDLTQNKTINSVTVPVSEPDPADMTILVCNIVHVNAATKHSPTM